MFSMQSFHRSSWTREPWRYLYLNQQNILTALAGFIWTEIKQMWDGGFQDYIHDWWNLMDFVMNSFYLATISLKIVAYVKVHYISITWKLVKSYLLTFTLSLLTVQWLQTQGNLGNVAPHTSGWGSVRHRQHLQLSTSYLTLHGQFSPRSFADIIRTDASGHPEVPLHLLPGVACLC